MSRGERAGGPAARRQRGILALVAAAALGGAACTEVGTDPLVAVALQFDRLPYPSVVAGDTLRDVDGRAAALQPLAFNAAGDPIVDARFTWVVVDTGLTVTPRGFVVASRGRTGEPRVIAQVGGLQSLALPVPVTRAPGVATAARTRDTLRYVLPDNATANVTPAASLTLVPSDTSGGVRGTRGWLVSYRLFWRGAPVPATDTLFALVDDQGRPSAVDTTGTDGVAGRRVRVRAGALPASVDSIIVEASARYLGRDVPGTPVRYTLLLRPRGTR